MTEGDVGAAGPSPPAKGPLPHELPQAVPPDGLPVRMGADAAVHHPLLYLPVVPTDRTQFLFQQFLHSCWYYYLKILKNSL